MLVYDDAHRPRLLAGRPEWQRWARDGAGHLESRRSWGPTSSAVGLRRRTGPSSATATSSPTPSSGRRSSTGTEPAAAAPADADHRLLLLQHEPDRARADRDGPRVGARAPLGGRPDALVPARGRRRPSGKVRLELVEGGVANRCEIDLATGLATLSHGGQPLGRAAPTGIRGTGTYDVAFANVDDRLTLWVDGRTAVRRRAWSTTTAPAPHPIPTAADLDPVGDRRRGGPRRR